MFTEQLLSEEEHSELKSNREVEPDHRDLGRPTNLWGLDSILRVMENCVYA